MWLRAGTPAGAGRAAEGTAAAAVASFRLTNPSCAACFQRRSAASVKGATSLPSSRATWRT